MELPSEETQRVLGMLITEVMSGMVLHVRTCQDKVWNDSRLAVIEQIKKYKHGEGLLQQ